AEGASPLDALVSLNQRAREQPDEATDWLTAAFLADVREDHVRMAKPDEGSSCPCANPDRLRHWHNWVLLLDNVDHPGGAAFLAASYYDIRCVLIQRATGGLPAAVHELARCLAGRALRPGARNVLSLNGHGEPDLDPWRTRLEGRRIADYLPDIGIDEFIA